MLLAGAAVEPALSGAGVEDDDSEEDSEDVTGAGVELSCVRSELGAVRMGEGAKALAPTTRRERMAVVLMVGYLFRPR